MQTQEDAAEGSPWNNSSGCEEERKPREGKKSNVLALWGNERTMNLNPLILTNILSSHYFKVNLYELKTYHEVIDEIYYKVAHLEPWEKGSRKTAGQTGMCGGRFMQVRGVGAGGIVSTAYCLLYKLFTLRLTRKQLNGLINHPDSPYIRALGFMYIRYTQPPADLFSWYDEYLDDEEEFDVKAGGGQMMKMGEILKQFLTKLEWFSTLFPRIPVPIQKELEQRLSERFPQQTINARNAKPPITLNNHGKYSSGTGRKDNGSSAARSQQPRHISDSDVQWGEAESRTSQWRARSDEDRRDSRDRYRDRERERKRSRERDRSRDRDRGSSRVEETRKRDRHSRKQSRERSRERSKRHRSRSRERSTRDRSREHYRDRYRERKNSPVDYAAELARERERQRR
ncbi:pre-mRNA-splicing factor 38B-like isoform X1 [Microplitis mediator]|uniref:pre-mRNA-splicing factor 38B-like isoform X1 n=2 Tax=Microplitis mediator TaxID=375433 RepID=UPI002555C4CA|nr:pre-mRNA-splicing factor 38B-like isoform X1 [Microplitis mediator]